jgi:hypothetical protein
MNEPKIPHYPVVHVTVHPDGSAHINVAGNHQNYPAGELDHTRAQVTAYAIAVATRLGRGVRMTTTDPDGEWKLGVYPDGEVVDFAPVPAKGRGATKANARRPRSAAAVGVAPALPLSTPNRSPTVVLERANVPDPRAQDVVGQARQPGSPVATLKFSTGDTAIIGPPAIIGRNPGSVVSDDGGSQLVIVNDHSRTVARAHADVAWVDGKLTLTNRVAGNGTSVVRGSGRPIDLAPGDPYQLLDGDVVHVGTDVSCTVATLAGSKL